MEAINIYSTIKNGFETLSNILNGTVTEHVLDTKGKLVLAKFKTVEHAYQCKKALYYNQEDLAVKIFRSNTGWEALKIARAVKINDDWNELGEIELEKSMRLCFEQNPKQLQLLLSTEDAILVHDSMKYINLGKWSTVFPNILMKIRTENK